MCFNKGLYSIFKILLYINLIFSSFFITHGNSGNSAYSENWKMQHYPPKSYNDDRLHHEEKSDIKRHGKAGYQLD